jgi:LacI family transcriptional regulator
MVCSIPDNFFSQVIHGIESIAFERNYQVIVTQNLESYQRELVNLQQLASRAVDGLLVSLSCETEEIKHFNRLIEKGYPIVFFDRVSDQVKASQVVSDNYGGAYKATSHLIINGYNKIAHLASSPHLSITQERLAGYLKALEDHGIPVNDEIIKYCMHGGWVEQELQTVMHELMIASPDAIFAATDRLTMDCFTYLYQNNFMIPEEVALVGFNNSSTADLFNPSLTIITQDTNGIGRKATELLINLIEKKSSLQKSHKEVLPAQLHIRGSTKKVE